MAHDKLRDDTECQNCGHEVLEIYCPHCGQKNIETRQSFGHLVGHFAEDLTHYDGAFWKTIKYLIFRPAKLTVEYLEGKRQLYVPPVKLYIFISFITFLLLSILPEVHVKGEEDFAFPKVSAEMAENDASEKKHDETELYPLSNNQSVRSVKELDSIYKLPGNKIPEYEYVLVKNALESKENASDEKFTEELFHLMPKIIFLYMPLFAFWLWLFHNKKRWLFFDHGIFTLHYFSLLLLIISIGTILEKLTMYINETAGQYVSVAVGIITLTYAFFYFFRAHSKMYGDKKIISRLKGIALFFINLICIFIVFVAVTLYIRSNAH